MNLLESLTFYTLLLISLLIFSYKVYKILYSVRLGKPERRLERMEKRILSTFGIIFGQWCSLKNVSTKDRAGIGHFLIFWTFVFFFINYSYIALWGAWHGPLSLLDFNNSFSWIYGNILDATALLCTFAVIWGLGRRYITKPKRLMKLGGIEPAIIMILILLLMITHFIGEGLRISLNRTSGGFIGQSISIVISSNLDFNYLQSLYHSVWWIHILIALGFLVYIPYSKHLHLIASPFNILFRSLVPFNLKPIEFETAEKFGAGDIKDFTWKQLLDSYACTKCGRCTDICPAANTGKPLSPMDLIDSLRELLSKVKEDKSVIGEESISQEMIWSCTTCLACQKVCPVYNEHVTKILEMRRYLVLEKGEIPETALRALKCLEQRGHPWSGTMFNRTDWMEQVGLQELTEDDDVEVLLWVGCTPALEERSQKIITAMVKILQYAGVKFGVLGSKEICCGDPARRMGHEYLFQSLALKNIETLRKHKVNKIVTICPHCFNMLKNEYPRLGGNFEVLHHSQYILELLRSRKIKVTGELEEKVTLHDSCYLSRYNSIYNEPREILTGICELVEMENNKDKTFCCGGGGGQLWMHETGVRMSHVRAQEAAETSAETLVTACPFCIQMFDDAVSTLELELKPVDIAEFVAERMLSR